MSYTFDSRLGEQLYQLLPAVYRTRDREEARATNASNDEDNVEDLARYLDAHGHLLDLIHATLEQQLKDALPASSQDWLLPYFAQLLAVNIVSPDSAGKHAEVDRAISWRQRKGTLQCAEEIAEAVGQMEVEIQEGWKRVAMTPRIGLPLIPLQAWDNTLQLNKDIPSEAARHPALPVVMLDLRRPSRAVESFATNPASQVSKFAGVQQSWRQANHHGVPCFPNSFDDISRRTVDMRTVDKSHGLYHHKRLLAFAPSPTGLFPLKNFQLKWSERKDSRYDHLIEEKEENGVWVIRNKTDRIISITEMDMLKPARPYRIEGLHFTTDLEVVSGGSLDLQSVEANTVRVNTQSTDEPVLTATDCLFNILSSQGVVKLDSCTVLDTAHISTSVQAINCIFNKINGEDITGSIAYSRTQINAPLSTDPTKMSVKSHQRNPKSVYGYDQVTDTPKFLQATNSLSAKAVLAADTEKSIYAGASDQAEMGYFHRGRKNRPVKIKGITSLSLPDDGGYPLSDIIFEDDLTVTSGLLILNRSAVPNLIVETPLNNEGNAIASLSATDSLFQSIEVENGLTRLECCTVMHTAKCKYLQASDCIFAGEILGVKILPDNSELNHFLNCLRFSSILGEFLDNIKNQPEESDEKKLARALQLVDKAGDLRLRSNTLEAPAFDKYTYCEDQLDMERVTARDAQYGEYGYGVLALHTDDTIRFGAEDGGEMGAYHHRYYALKAEAMLDKIREFLPVGIEPVLIYDKGLLQVPVENMNLSNGGTP